MIKDVFGRSKRETLTQILLDYNLNRLVWSCKLAVCDDIIFKINEQYRFARTGGL